MPKKRTFKLPTINLGEESLGQRLARLRKEQGYTQIDLAEKIAQGESQDKELRNIRVLISDYERNKVQPNYEMIVRFALALKVTSDELLGLKQPKYKNAKPNLKIQKRITNIESLPPSEQKMIFKTLDALIVAAKK